MLQTLAHLIALLTGMTQVFKNVTPLELGLQCTDSSLIHKLLLHSFLAPDSAISFGGSSILLAFAALALVSPSSNPF